MAAPLKPGVNCSTCGHRVDHHQLTDFLFADEPLNPATAPKDREAHIWMRWAFECQWPSFMSPNGKCECPQLKVKEDQHGKAQ